MFNNGRRAIAVVCSNISVSERPLPQSVNGIKETDQWEPSVHGIKVANRPLQPYVNGIEPPDGQPWYAVCQFRTVSDGPLRQSINGVTPVDGTLCQGGQMQRTCRSDRRTLTQVGTCSYQILRQCRRPCDIPIQPIQRVL